MLLCLDEPLLARVLRRVPIRIVRCCCRLRVQIMRCLSFQSSVAAGSCHTVCLSRRVVAFGDCNHWWRPGTPLPVEINGFEPSEIIGLAAASGTSWLLHQSGTVWMHNRDARPDISTMVTGIHLAQPLPIRGVQIVQVACAAAHVLMLSSCPRV